MEMETKVQNQILKSKQQIESNKKSISSSREILERFYKGFKNFESMHLGENFIVFKMPSPSRVPNAIEKAEQHIAENNLPLQVVGGKHNLNTFLVKTI